jgi:hypothetical protein
MEKTLPSGNVCYHPKEVTTTTKHVRLLISEKKTLNLSQQYRYWPDPNRGEELTILRIDGEERFPKITNSRHTHYNFITSVFPERQKYYSCKIKYF